MQNCSLFDAFLKGQIPLISSNFLQLKVKNFRGNICLHQIIIPTIIEISELIISQLQSKKSKLFFVTHFEASFCGVASIFELCLTSNKDLTGSQAFNLNYENDEPTIHRNTNSNVRNDKIIEAVHSHNHGLMLPSQKCSCVYNLIHIPIKKNKHNPE